MSEFPSPFTWSDNNPQEGLTIITAGKACERDILHEVVRQSVLNAEQEGRIPVGSVPVEDSNLTELFRVLRFREDGSIEPWVAFGRNYLFELDNLQKPARIGIAIRVEPPVEPKILFCSKYYDMAHEGMKHEGFLQQVANALNAKIA